MELVNLLKKEKKRELANNVPKTYCKCNWYLIWTAFVIRAVLLINDYRVKDTSHDNVPENNVSCISIARPGPRFYSHSILSSCEN